MPYLCPEDEEKEVNMDKEEKKTNNRLKTSWVTPAPLCPEGRTGAAGPSTRRLPDENQVGVLLANQQDWDPWAYGKGIPPNLPRPACQPSFRH